MSLIADTLDHTPDTCLFSEAAYENATKPSPQHSRARKKEARRPPGFSNSRGTER
jgi:hypothetical protein